MGSHCGLELELVGFGNSPAAGPDDRPWAPFYGHFWADFWVVLEAPYLHAMEDMGSGIGICFGTDCLLP